MLDDDDDDIISCWIGWMNSKKSWVFWWLRSHVGFWVLWEKGRYLVYQMFNAGFSVQALGKVKAAKKGL